MDAKKLNKPKNTKKPLSDMDTNIDTDFRLIIQHTLEEVQSQLTNVSVDFKASLVGIEKEIKEIKSLAQRNRKLLINLSGSPSVEEKEPELIATGLDVISKLPSHLRRTYTVMLSRFDKTGATASEVAKITLKSRPLESDYLNQLFDKGFLKKKPHPTNPRRRIFVLKAEGDKGEDENGITLLSDSVDDNNIELIIQDKKLQKMRKML